MVVRRTRTGTGGSVKARFLALLKGSTMLARDAKYNYAGEKLFRTGRHYIPRRGDMRSQLLTVMILGIAAYAGLAQDKTTTKKGTGTTTSGFQAPCAMPFSTLAQAGLSIDRTCGTFGKASPDTAEGRQNQAKNNFCASGDPLTVTPSILAQLQAAAEKQGITFGSEKELPSDRAALQHGFSIGGQQFGEGKLVRMSAFLIETHFADLSGGESVNCGVAKDTASNDIHMAMGLAYGADECTSVTAELSPHSRPKAWNAIADIKAKGKTSKPSPLTQHPIRVTGQLFFDGSHKLCAGGKETSGNPARQSLWEVHPVYAVDVCRNETLNTCKADDETVWVPLDQWKPGN
jgi:hypothetical protein